MKYLFKLLMLLLGVNVCLHRWSKWSEAAVSVDGFGFQIKICSKCNMTKDRLI
jgi:hypothetical protein